jgi:phosphatidylglycerol:prolipoprotein diacylglycerol transferase
MITINVNPIAFSIGIFDVRWYGIMVVLAVVAVIALSVLEARRVGLADEHIYSMALWAIIGGILMARLFHVIDKWDYYMAHPSQIIGFEGLAVYGAVLGALLAVLGKENFFLANWRCHSPGSHLGTGYRQGWLFT